jgi:hypothetical protein
MPCSQQVIVLTVYIEGSVFEVVHTRISFSPLSVNTTRSFPLSLSFLCQCSKYICIDQRWALPIQFIYSNCYRANKNLSEYRTNIAIGLQLSDLQHWTLDLASLPVLVLLLASLLFLAYLLLRVSLLLLTSVMLLLSLLLLLMF